MTGQKGIIWISSYPKSGNTWVRYLLSNYFFSNNKNDLNFEIIDNIPAFNTEFVFNKKRDEYPKDLNDLFPKWMMFQEKINFKNGDTIFLKNHNANINIDGKYFTNENYTKAIIYIVRDPRDVVISGSNFFRKDFDWMVKLITDKEPKIMYSKKSPYDATIYGSWKFNYLSWKNNLLNRPTIIIRYEDLINNVEKIFLNLLIFLSQIINFKINKEQLNASIENSKFDLLQKNEKNMGFKESINNARFFNKGKIGQWKDKLNTNQIQKIENDFKFEMKELGYL